MAIIDDTNTEQNIPSFIDYPTCRQVVQCQLCEPIGLQEMASSMIIQTFLDANSPSGIYADELIDLFHGKLTDSRNIEHFSDIDQDIDSDNQNLVDARPSIFVAEVNALAEESGVTEALRYMYDKLDDLLLARNFDQCNQILRIINPYGTDLKLLIGYLTITLAWKQNLTERTPLVNQIRQLALKQLSEVRVNSLLKGLT